MVLMTGSRWQRALQSIAEQSEQRGAAENGMPGSAGDAICGKFHLDPSRLGSDQQDVLDEMRLTGRTMMRDRDKAGADVSTRIAVLRLSRSVQLGLCAFNLPD